jgi:hypothetical protein
LVHSVILMAAISASPTSSLFPSRASSYQFLQRLGKKTSHTGHQLFYGTNGAVYLARLSSPFLPTAAPPPSSSTILLNEFVIKIVYNYDDSLATSDLSAHGAREMKLC